MLEEKKHYERLTSIYLEDTDASEKNAAEGNSNSIVRHINPHLQFLEADFLYHLDLAKCSNSVSLKEMFGDVRFICMGGTQKRMLMFAHYIKDLIGHQMPVGHTFQNICQASDRYAMYKIGPVLSVSHGIGCPSMSILIHELIKLVHYAECKDVKFFRIGTSGGVGVKAGTLVITEEAVDGMFRPEYRQIILGREVVRKTKCDMDLINELMKIGEKFSYTSGLEDVIIGKTLCAHDFYEGQGRIDGAFCHYGVKEKSEFLQKCKEEGVRNLEMESLCFTALLGWAKLSAAVVCVTIVDRLAGDQITISHEKNVEFQERPIKLVGEYIKAHLNKDEKQ